MRNLTLVGLTEDGAQLLLVGDTGEEFVLAADARLRAALRGEHARLGQLEIQMESALRPRDIQARIRAGESPESVAAAAQTTVDRIMGFATPVLAERAHIAQRAQSSSVRRRAGEAPTSQLAEAVAERLRSRNVDPGTVEWDSWRREDGRWTLVADYLSGESARHAEFVYDAPGRYVVADDDEARWLVGEQSSLTGPQPRLAGGRRRLSAVGSADELPLGEDAIDMVSRPEAPPAGVERGAATGDADWIPTRADEPLAESGPAAVESADPAARDVDEDDSSTDPPPAPKQPAKKARGRASVPSWDEIMFGGGPQD